MRTKNTRVKIGHLSTITKECRNLTMLIDVSSCHFIPLNVNNSLTELPSKLRVCNVKYIHQPSSQSFPKSHLKLET